MALFTLLISFIQLLKTQNGFFRRKYLLKYFKNM